MREKFTDVLPVDHQAPGKMLTVSAPSILPPASHSYFFLLKVCSLGMFVFLIELQSTEDILDLIEMRPRILNFLFE